MKLEGRYGELNFPAFSRTIARKSGVGTKHSALTLDAFSNIVMCSFETSYRGLERSSSPQGNPR